MRADSSAPTYGADSREEPAPPARASRACRSSASASASRRCSSPLRSRRLALGADGVLAEQRECDGRVGVDDDGVRQHARIHLAPAHRLGRGGARQPAPDHLVGGDLDEVIVAALRDAVHLPQRRLALQVEVLRRAAPQDHAAVLLGRQDDGAHLVDVPARIDHQPALLHEPVPGDVHADGAVSRRRRVDRHACRRRLGDHRVLLALGAPLEQVASEPVVQLGARGGAVEPAADEELADVRVGLEQHGGGKQHVVDADDAVLVQLDVVEERRPAVEGEVQGVVQVVVEIRTGADHEVDETAVEQLDDAPA